MKIEIMIAVLGIICIGALAAVFVLWAKVDELKKIAADEHANYLAALNLHNEVTVYAQAIDELNEFLFREANKDFIRFRALNNDLQDRLSAILCPMNDHVWRDGVCVKCGRVKDG